MKQLNQVCATLESRPPNLVCHLHGCLANSILCEVSGGHVVSDSEIYTCILAIKKAVKPDPNSNQKATCNRQYKCNLLIRQLLFTSVLVTVQHQVPQEQNIKCVRNKQPENLGANVSLRLAIFSC